MKTSSAGIGNNLSQQFPAAVSLPTISFVTIWTVPYMANQSADAPDELGRMNQTNSLSYRAVLAVTERAVIGSRQMTCPLK